MTTSTKVEQKFLSTQMKITPATYYNEKIKLHLAEFTASFIEVCGQLLTNQDGKARQDVVAGVIGCHIAPPPAGYVRP